MREHLCAFSWLLVEVGEEFLLTALLLALKIFVATKFLSLDLHFYLKENTSYAPTYKKLKVCMSL